MEKTFFQDYKNLMLSFEALKKTEDNPFFRSKFVPLNQILPIVKKHCGENNFMFSQRPARQDGKNILVTEIIHSSGEKLIGEIEIVSKEAYDPQKVGAGMTYMRRYSLVCMFGLEDMDDDGNFATGNGEYKSSTGRYTEPAGAKDITKDPVLGF
jgi:hypothetical protein